jgi:hypothetical protein
LKEKSNNTREEEMDGKMTEEQNLLLDCWLQWSYYNPATDIRSAAGLSVLEDIEDYLYKRGFIDDAGHPKSITGRNLK